MRDVDHRVPPVGERQAVADQPSAQVFALNPADRDDAPVAVPVALLAGDRPAVDWIRQDIRRSLPAPPPLAADVAWLPALGRVDAVQPDPLSVNLDGVAVDHRRLAGHVGERDGW